MKTVVFNGTRALPGVLQTMDHDFWKEWAELRATIATLQSQQGFQSATLLRIERSEYEAAGKRMEIEKLVAGMRAESERQVAALNARLDGLEGKGIAAWSTRRVTQLAAMVAGLAAIFAGVFSAVNWLIAHYK